MAFIIAFHGILFFKVSKTLVGCKIPEAMSNFMIFCDNLWCANDQCDANRLPIVAPCDRKRIMSLWASVCGGNVPLEYHLEFAKVRSLSPHDFVQRLAKEMLVKGVVAGNYGYAILVWMNMSARWHLFLHELESSTCLSVRIMAF